MEFQDKICVVTGAGGNIGRHICLHFVRGGAKAVAVIDCNSETAEKTVAELRALGCEAEAFVCDLKVYANVHETFDKIIAKWGRVDILATAAGGSTRQFMTSLDKQRPEIIEDNIGVNLYGTLWAAKEAASDFERRGASGRIICITSILGIQGRQNSVEYSAAKAGIIAMSKSLAKELGHLGVTVNCVSPGLVNRPGDNTDVRHTNYLGEYCTADDIAEAVGFLASDKAKFVTGHNLIVDGGRSIALKGT
ncbi:MAG: SDR family oxidoreductase [Clostridia bacterium]|nr:SDR family oxidoreductase [Clostridia bacterium]